MNNAIVFFAGIPGCMGSCLQSGGLYSCGSIGLRVPCWAHLLLGPLLPAQHRISGDNYNVMDIYTNDNDNNNNHTAHHHILRTSVL